MVPTRRPRARLAVTLALAALPSIPAAAVAQVMSFAPEDTAGSGAASRSMDDGLRLYDQKNYAAASLEFHKVVEATDPESEKFKQKAEYSLAKSLFHMGLYQSSLGYFDRIVQVGRDHKYHKATLKWLYLISRKLGDPAILEKIATYDRADFPEEYRNEISFLLGQYHYKQGNLDEAMEFLKAVEKESAKKPGWVSEYFLKAKFLEGALWVRKDDPRALDSFKDVLQAVSEGKGDARKMEHYERLAWLNMARAFYSNGKPEVAIKYFDRIPQDSPLWLDALFEASWAFFMTNNFEKALGNLHTLNSPFFDTEYYPESEILLAVILFYNCHYDEVRKHVDDFTARYNSLYENVQTYLKQYSEPNEFYEFLLRLNQQGGERSALLQQVFNAAFRDRELARMHRYIRKLDAEIARAQAIGGAWGASDLAQNLVQDLTGIKSLAMQEAGTLARARLERVSAQIRDLLSQARKIKFETANAEKGILENQIRDEAYVGKDIREVGDLTATDPEHVYWPFEGEYWRDELGSYLYSIRSECGR